jgi:hypothetical protein
MYRPLSFVTLMLISLNALAQPPTGMSESDMQGMMQGMQAMQECMAKIDMAAVDRFSAEGKQVEAEVRSLCAAGKREAAQHMAIAFGMKITQDPAMKAMAGCSKKMQGTMPKMPQQPYADLARDKNRRHVCDK